MTDTTYNGWTNHATWLVNLHLDNTYCMTDSLTEEAADMLGNQYPEADLADYIKELVAEWLEPDCPNAGLAQDLINGYLDDVNWREIATHYIDAAKEGLEQ